MVITAVPITPALPLYYQAPLYVNMPPPRYTNHRPCHNNLDKTAHGTHHHAPLYVNMPPTAGAGTNQPPHHDDQNKTPYRLHPLRVNNIPSLMSTNQP